MVLKCVVMDCEESAEYIFEGMSYCAKHMTKRVMK